MNPMLETMTIAVTTFFATIAPLNVAVIFAGLTSRDTPRRRITMAVKGVCVAGGLLVLFALFGRPMLNSLGISLHALRLAGGFLLVLIATDMVFARHSGVSSTTQDEAEEAELRQDISVFPLATPLLAGPGAMGSVILLSAGAEGDPAARLGVIIALGIIMTLTLILLVAAGQVQRLLGVTGLNVVSRVFGVLLAALGMQFMLDGIRGSGILSGMETAPASAVSLLPFPPVG
jgi:multiple antibiotic resistance protein